MEKSDVQHRKYFKGSDRGKRNHQSKQKIRHSRAQNRDTEPLHEGNDIINNGKCESMTEIAFQLWMKTYP
jgi:hypothetical protein